MARNWHGNQRKTLKGHISLYMTEAERKNCKWSEAISPQITCTFFTTPAAPKDHVTVPQIENLLKVN